MARRVSQIAGIGSPQLIVGLIEGGINTNVVPDRVVFRLDRRIIPEEDPAEVEAELRQRHRRRGAQRIRSIAVDVRRILLAEPFVPLPGQEQLVDALPACAARIWASRSRPAACRSTPTRATTPRAGIPTVLYGAGPRTLEEANGHRADESLVLDDLRKATEVVALTLLDLLSSPSSEGSVRTSAAGFAGPHAPSPRGASRRVL